MVAALLRLPSHSTWLSGSSLSSALILGYLNANKTTEQNSCVIGAALGWLCVMQAANLAMGMRRGAPALAGSVLCAPQHEDAAVRVTQV